MPPRPTVTSGACPWLPHELSEWILDLAAVFAVSPPTPTSSTIQKRMVLRSGRALSGNLPNLPSPKAQLLNIVMVVSDLRVAARLLIPLLRTWPPQTAVVLGRVDVLERARSVGLLNDCYSSHQDTAVRLIHNAVYRASERGHANVVRWFNAHWPDAVQQDDWSARLALAVWGASAAGIPLLDCWFGESGVLAHVELEHRKVVVDRLMGRSWYTGMQSAIQRGQVALVAWWAERLDLPWVPGVWYASWIKMAILSEKTDLLDVLAQLEEAGKIQFQEHSGGVSNGRVQLMQDMIMDTASTGDGCVPVLEWWKQRQQALGKPLVFSEMAIYDTESVTVLEWWFSQPDLRTQLSTSVIIQLATEKGRIHVLDWCLRAFKSGLLSSLDYDEWIMVRASISLQPPSPSSRDGLADITNRISVKDVDPYSGTDYQGIRIAVLDWWDKSQLDLKLPGPHTPSVTSPIDVCANPRILQWWLERARRLAHASGLSVQHHFPHYTWAAIHRASYWGFSAALDWWWQKARSVSLELRYTPQRAVELAAIGQYYYPASLRWWIRKKGEDGVAFRGNLVEWGRRQSLFPCLIGPLPSAQSIVRILKSNWIDVGLNGGMDAPPEGYGRPEPGEEQLFLFRRPSWYHSLRQSDGRTGVERGG